MDDLMYILFAILLAYGLYFIFIRHESFWGGYYPMPYTGQPTVQYGRYGYDAATDNPRMLVNPCAYPINPTNS